MFRPELYQEANSVVSAPRRDTFECLEKFADRLKLREGGCVMDLGCGDGTITVTVLRQFLPQDFKKLLGTDVGEKMVEYANREHGDYRTSFRVWDMSSEVPREFLESFDLVFSSYAIHWVQDQEKVFSNVHKMLNDNGQCLLVFIRYIPIHDVYRVLAKKTKWSQLLRNAEVYISPYHDLPDSAKRVRGIMAKIGFNNITVKCEEKSILYEEPQFRSTMESICPFKIPPDQYQDFMSDYMEAVRDIMIVTETNEKTFVQVNYSLLIANGTRK